MQEFAVNHNVVIVCGGSSINAKTADMALMAEQLLEEERKSKVNSWLIRQVPSVFEDSARSYVDNIFTRRQRCHSGTVGAAENIFCRVLATSLVLKVDHNWPENSDDRDRVFSLLNLALDAGDFIEFPNYSLDCRFIYKEVAFKFLKQGHIDVLSYVQFPKIRPSLPSRVPDWSMKVRRPYAHFPWKTGFSASASARFNQNVSRHNIHQLVMWGVSLDIIREFSSITWDPDWSDSETPVDISDTKVYVESIMSFCKRFPRALIHEEELDVARIAIADAGGLIASSQATNYFQSCYEGMLSLLKDSTNNNQESEMYYSQGEDPRESDWYKGLKRIHSRRVFISSNGFVGLCPWNVEKGDELCIFFRDKTPYLVYPGQDGTYELIGEAYVYGVMYGEAMKDDKMKDDKMKAKAFILK